MISPLIDKCQVFVEAQLKGGRDRTSIIFHNPRPPAITVSRQVGARGAVICEMLAERLNKTDKLARCPWTLFDKNLIRTILEDHHHPLRLAQFLTEDRPAMLESIVGEILGLHPSLWTLFEQTTETILKLIKLGNTIIVGRGGAIIGANQPNCIHVRLIGSFERRVERVLEIAHMPAERASGFLKIERDSLMEHLKPSFGEQSPPWDILRTDIEDYVKKGDRARKRYFKTNFRSDIDNPLHYSIVMNTDSITDAEIVNMIAEVALARRPPP
ncbi:MAG: cytidylate kinase-like family protein [Verrucomicrobia bacterium]|nr:cytidylate kinase-like family protein [Verrucomicrobiota bacterium]